MSSSNWNKKEKEYLEEKWGVISIPALSKHLNRSENAVKSKAYKMGLGRFIDNGEYMSWKEFLSAFEMEVKNTSYAGISWIENRDFPVRYKLIQKGRVKVVHLNEFWRWAEKNKHFIDFSKLQVNALGKEPAWVKKKRVYDIEKKVQFKSTPWTKDEDRLLHFLLKEQKYTYDEIAKRLCRTSGAVTRRINDLGFKERPLRVDNRSFWSNDEILELENLICQGASYEVISNKVNRSTSSVRGIVYRTYGSENLDKACKKINELRRVTT